MMNKEKTTELSDLMKPVIQWLADNGDPHTIVVADFERFDLYRAEAGGAIGYFRGTEK